MKLKKHKEIWVPLVMLSFYGLEGLGFSVRGIRRLKSEILSVYLDTLQSSSLFWVWLDFWAWTLVKDYPKKGTTLECLGRV